MAGCCGAKQPSNTEFLVTFKDGSTKRVATMPEARIVIAQDTTVDPNGRRKAATYAIVPKGK